MQIYLVIGTTGEYEDTYEWVSKAFTSKQVAEQFLKKCNDYTYTAPLKANGNKDYYDEKWIENSPDPKFYCDYTGARYNLEEVELITNNFMEAILRINHGTN